MLDTAVHQLRFILSVAFGFPFSPGSLERLVASTKATIHEFGSLSADGADLVNGLALDAETQRELVERRFRKQARRAARETSYYRELFASIDINPDKLRYDDIARIPLTRKEALRAHPDAFVTQSSTPFIQAMTTGTTGRPTSLHFSSREMRIYSALTALSLLVNSVLSEADIVQISVSGRGMLGNVVLAGAAGHIGALVYQTGIVDPAAALAALTEKRSLPRKKARTSFLYTYPSYLGALVEYGLANGYGPTDFGLEYISIGGEIVTQGLKDRARQLFGDVKFREGYGITELWPLGGDIRANGMLDFDPSYGLIEVLDPETYAPTQPGQVGTIVATPFPPYRETTLLLRYDTEDLVRLPEQQTGGRFMTSNVLGKKRLCLRHNDGWVTPRDVQEVLEGFESVVLPAAYGFYAVENGVGVEVVVRETSPSTHAQIAERLEAAGIPLQELVLRASADELTSAYPQRGNLREYTFASDPVRKEAVL